jgi:nanoRNase/pAp phosphatase (c-di-AMP/oligoRNAs hydrolase)
MGNLLGGKKDENAPDDGARGEERERSPRGFGSALSFVEFGMELVSACSRASDQNLPVLLFADPDLDGLCAMYALKRAMSVGMPNLRVECYQLPNGTDNKVPALDSYIRKHYPFMAPIGVFMDVMPMAEDNKHVQVPASLSKAFCIDHHPKLFPEAINERLVVCESNGLATSGMVYHMIDQSMEAGETQDRFRETWERYLSIANYADLGYKQIGAKMDKTRVPLLGGGKDMESKPGGTIPFAVKCKLAALMQISSGEDIRREHAKILPMTESFAQDPPPPFDLEGEITLGLDPAYVAVISWYMTPSSWQPAMFVPTTERAHELLDPESTYTVAMSKDELIKHLESLFPEIPEYLLKDVAVAAMLPFQQQLVTVQEPTDNNSMDPEYAKILGIDHLNKKKHIWLIYLEVAHGSASVRKLGGSRSCQELAEQFGGAGGPFAAGVGDLGIKLTMGVWEIQSYSLCDEYAKNAHV